MRRIGILGGTFDPPHIGHLILAEYSVEALGLVRVLFVPAADPPHKKGVPREPIEHRMAMLERATAGNGKFSISLVDVDRPGPHYSLDMVRILQEQYPDAELFFVMGGDSLRDLPKWHCPHELMKLCKFAVMPRPGDAVYPAMHESVLPGLNERVIMVDAPVLEISSSDIVARLHEGKSIRYLVPDDVLLYIAANSLYKDT